FDGCVPASNHRIGSASAQSNRMPLLAPVTAAILPGKPRSMSGLLRREALFEIGHHRRPRPLEVDLGLCPVPALAVAEIAQHHFGAIVRQRLEIEIDQSA